MKVLTQTRKLEKFEEIIRLLAEKKSLLKEDNQKILISLHDKDRWLRQREDQLSKKDLEIKHTADEMNKKAIMTEFLLRFIIAIVLVLFAIYIGRSVFRLSDESANSYTELVNKIKDIEENDFY